MYAAVMQHSTHHSVDDVVRIFEWNDLDQFKKALDNGANVNLRTSSTRFTVFELACITPGRKSYIEACIKHGALVTEQNPYTNEYPIHLAARSFDSENLKQLLKTPLVDVDQKFEDRTALYLLFEQINSYNWKVVFECIKLLLKYYANINATDKNSVSPIALLVTPGNDAWRKEILQYCFQNYAVNVDFRRNQARKAIEKHFPGTVIPDIDMETVTVEVLRNKLAAGSEDEFLTAFDKYIGQTEGHVLREEDCAELLSVAVYRSKLTAAQKLIQGQIVNGKFVGKLQLLSGLLAKCCNRGNVPMLEWLLKIIPDESVSFINEDALLSLLVKQIDVYKDKNKCPLFKSMGILLNDPRIEVDKLDEAKITALHYAVKYKIDHAQELLLAKGAYIGGEDLFGDSPISEMDSNLLEKHLDSCVTSNNRKLDEKGYKMRVDFSNFIPLYQLTNDTTEDLTAIDVEMHSISKIAQSVSKRHLLWHPVISSILLLKWLRFIYLFYINLIFTGLFTISLTLYIVLYFRTSSENIRFDSKLYPLSVFGWAYLIARELIQFLLNMRAYIRSPINGMELLLISMSGVILFVKLNDEIYTYVVGSTILLLGLELTLQVGMLPVDSISTNMRMLNTVSKHFLTSFRNNLILLLSFALSFYMVFRPANINERNVVEETQTTTQGDDPAERFNEFREVPLAFVKTIVMFTGELEAANFNNNTSWMGFTLLMLFVLLVVIVMNNMVIGIAVSDTSKILAESETIGIANMVSVICWYENTTKALNSYPRITRFLRNNWCSWLFPSQNMTLFHCNKPLKQIILKPHQAHIINYETLLLETKRNGNGKPRSARYTPLQQKERQQKDGNAYNTMHFFYWGFNRMLRKIVESTKEILLSRQKNQSSIGYRLSRMEEQLNIIVQGQLDLRKEIQSITRSLEALSGKLVEAPENSTRLPLLRR